MSDVPSFKEDHISQIPALQLLQNAGYDYLTPREALDARNGKVANVLLETILFDRLRRINQISYKGEVREFSDASIHDAIRALREVPFDGLVRTSEKVYDLLTLGKSCPETVQGDTKSFTLQYVDWKSPRNNVFHVTEEFAVERTGSYENCRPDLVLFVNGIPFVVVECKRPDIKDPLGEAVSQHIRNQDVTHIPRLFVYAQLLVAVTKNEAAYATTGTPRKFWLRWRERDGVSAELRHAVHSRLNEVQKQKLFSDRFGYVRRYFDKLEREDRYPTEQDQTLFSLCRLERLLELTYQFVVYDAGEKKIARYQQYFAVKSTLERVREIGPDGRRRGGVIWHTQGSGKSLTMVILAKALALDSDIPNPRVILVTDRIDLDDQIWKTFRQCGKEPEKARTGKHLIQLIRDNKHAVITTVIDKFEAAVKSGEFVDPSTDIFVLVDESHRSQYGTANANMQKVLPNACYLAFTGTPLMKRERNTANRFGGFIDTYTIEQAVEDKAVVPLVYEGRHVLQDVDQKAIDKWFEIVSKPLTEAQRADLKRKFSTANQLNKADRKIQLMAYDVSEHFRQNWKGTGFKAQLAADSKRSALKFKKFLDEFGEVTSEVLISAPDTREGNDDVYDVGSDDVQAFWRRTMEKYGSETEYNRQVISAFKNGDEPDIIIVVDKLLTGFDAPRNTVLYIAKSLQEHALLQAIARVNRLFEGKDFGYIVDYYGVLKQLGEAMDLYSSLPEFEKEDLALALTDVTQEINALRQKHSELWDVFKTVPNRLDEEAYEQLLADETERQKFYTKLSTYSRSLALALSTLKFHSETPREQIEQYKNDLAFFQKLRVSVRKRYSDEIDYKEYEAKVQKLIDTYVSSDDVVQITPPVNIFEQEKFREEIDRLQTTASKADTIAHRTRKTIVEKMDEDPFFYRKFSKILEEVIEAYHEQRITDAEYLNQVTQVMKSVVNRTDEFPPELRNNDSAKAFYGVAASALGHLELSEDRVKSVAANAALQIDRIVQQGRVVDWTSNVDAQNTIRNAIDDFLFSLRDDEGLSLSFEDMDAIIENALDVAKVRYA